MNNTIQILIFILFWVLSASIKAQVVAPELQKIVGQILENHYPSEPLHGLSIGIIQNKQINTFHCGNLATDAPIVSPNNTTLYQLGSISKVFTAALLAAMVADSSVQLNDPITKYLPDSLAFQNPLLKQITLLQLVTHTAGFPTKPSNIINTNSNPDDPYNNYTLTDLYTYLSTYHPQLAKKNKRNKNNTFAYSHLSIGLLGHLLENASGKTYQQLLEKYIINKINCKDIFLEPSIEQQSRIVAGHNFVGKSNEPLHYRTLYASEGVYGSLDNLLKFVYTNIDNTPNNPLRNIALKMQIPYAATQMHNVYACLGWYQIKQTKHVPIVYTHSGRVGGYSHYVAFSPEKKIGIVVMSNTSQRIDDIGIEILSYLLEIK